MCFTQSPEYVAVIDFSYNGISKSNADALSDRLRAELGKLEEFNLIDRKAMEEILSEQYFQYSGCVSEKCMVELGNMIGASQIIGGSISKIDNYYTISSKIIDVETGRIIKTAIYDDDEGVLSNLLVHGMRDIASQLAGIAIPKEVSNTQFKQNQNFSNKNKKINWKKPFYPYSFGIESFGLPYKTEGKCFSIWASYYNLKLKYSAGKLNVPELYVRDGFEKMKLEINLINLEYFIDENNLVGLWIGAGIMSYNGSLGFLNQEARGNFELLRLGVSSGYIKKIFHNVSINTYVGAYVLIMGDKEFQVGNKKAQSDVITPIASIEIGWHI